MATKYQVFVSSTFEDLKDERDVVIKAILEMGHIPVGMEMFSAADDEQWKIIARHIDESDYYCVIVAHRYGSSVGGVSYTRKEYEYAASRGIPILGFVIDDGVAWPAGMIDKEDTAVAALEAFKAQVKAKPVSFWKSTEDLYGRVSVALMKQMTANPREGWVRASGAATDPKLTGELTRLSAENADLRDQVHNLMSKIEQDRSAEISRLINDLGARSRKFGYKYTAQDSEWSRAAVTYREAFFYLAPALATEVELHEAAKSLAMDVRADHERPWWTVATNQLRDFFADLMALKLIEPSKRKHAVSDTGEYWALSEFGHQVHLAGRLRMMGSTDEAPTAEVTTNEATDGAVADEPSSEELV